MGSEKMDIEVVRECFLAAKKDGDVIVIEHLMKGYAELARLYDMMGSLFAFVAKDMRGRLTVLEGRRANPKIAEHYQTVQSALAFEGDKANKKLVGGGTTGKRAMLEMHYDIEFFIEMFRKLAAGTDESKCSELSREAFDKTLSNNVNFAVRHAARLAMRWLPTRKVFIDSYIKQDTEECVAMIDSTTVSLKNVYDVMDAEFAKGDSK